ncbi:ankyrin repeat protein [Rutstroemia sp. NJR-2017a BVV2]|nr:ankyrin repeat protein [Rutstroemia sp. NJR-2017a BVV2]
MSTFSEPLLSKFVDNILTMSGTEIKGKRAANNALWEKHKSLLEKLYLKDGMSLRSTMEFMAMNHGFNMSKAQYETMFKKWEFRKNIVEKEWISIDRCIENRRVLDKRSTITMGNFHVNPKRIERARARYSGQISREIFLRGTILLPLTRFHVETSITSKVTPQNLNSLWNTHSQAITIGTPPPLESDCWHRSPDDLPWFRFLSTFNDKRMYFSANVLNTGREVIRSFTFAYGSNKIPVPGLHRTMQQAMFGWLQPRLPSKPDSYPAINLEQAFGLTTKTPHLEFLKLAAYMLSNSIYFGEYGDIGMKMIELCHSRGMLQILERVLADKQCTLRVMAEQLLVFAVLAGDKLVTQILLKAGTSPKAILYGTADAFSVAIAKKRNELLPLLICAKAREDEHATQVALEELEDVSFKGLLKLSLEAKQPLVTGKLLDADFSISTAHSSSILYHALKKHDVEVVELVLNYEAGRLWQYPSYLVRAGPPLTCLEVACSTGSIPKFQLLLQNIGRIRGSGCGGFRKCLPYAAQSGNRQLVEDILIQGAQINDTTSSGMSCLELVDMNDLPMVQYLLGCGANPNHPATDLVPPLHRAAISGNLAAVKLLLDHGAQIGRISGRPGSQGLIVRDAVLGGNIAVVEEMLKADAAPNLWINKNCATALQLASSLGSIDIVRLLLSYNADINAPPGCAPEEDWTDSVTVLTGALRSRNMQLVSYLLDQGADVNNPRAEHEAPSPLQVCIRFFDYEMMVQLLTRGANPEDSGALWKAVCKRDFRSVNLLLDLNRKLLSQKNLSQGRGSTDYGRAALSEAILSNQSELICALLKAGVDFKRPPTQVFRMIKERSYPSAILAAVEAMNLNLLQIFLGEGKHHLRENLRKDGESELLLAIHSIDFKHKDAVKILKLLGVTAAEINSYSLKSHRSQTAIQKAISDGCCPSTVNYLLSQGADINSMAGIHSGRTALQAAAEKDRDDIVELLIGKGACVNACPASWFGATAFQFAAINGNFKIAQLLLEAGADAFAPRGKHISRSAIEGAAELGRLDMVLYLLHLADSVVGIDFEHQLCRATKWAWNRGHFVLSETIQGHQKDKFGRVHCERVERHDTDFYLTNISLSVSEDDEDNFNSDTDSDTQSEISSPPTSLTNSSLPIRGPNIDGTPEVVELDPPKDCDSPNIHNIFTHSNCLGSSGEEYIQHEITENYKIASADDPNLPEFVGTLTQEREDNQVVDPNPLPDNYLSNFLDIPGSMATPQWDGCEITEKYQTVIENDPDPPESVEILYQEMEEPMVITNLFSDDYLTNFPDIPGSMATPRWHDLDTFYDADMKE